MDLAPVSPPRAIGEVRLSVRNGPRGTAIAGLRQSGAFKAVFPRVTGAGATPPLEAVLVNTAGGITGGDRFSCTLQAGAGSHLRLTTQAAERAYRARPGETGRVANRLSVAAGARLDWLPQETILFEGCCLERSLIADLAPGARLLLVEPLVFGRALMGERLHAARFRDRIEIRRDGAPLYLDALRFEGDVAAQLARPAVAGGAGALASLVLVAPDAAAHLAPIRALLPAALPAIGGASLLAGDVLALRLLAADSYHLRKVLIPVLTRLTEALPRSWMS